MEISNEELEQLRGKCCRCGCKSEARYVIKTYEYYPREVFIEAVCLSAMLYLKESASELNFPYKERRLSLM